MRPRLPVDETLEGNLFAVIYLEILPKNEPALGGGWRGCAGVGGGFRGFEFRVQVSGLRFQVSTLQGFKALSLDVRGLSLRMFHVARRVETLWKLGDYF